MIGFGFGISGVAARSKGVPEYIMVDGVVYQLLTGADGVPLTGLDGQYLYGRV